MEANKFIIAIDPSLSNTAIIIGNQASSSSMKTFGSKPVGPMVAERIPRFAAQVAEVKEFIRREIGAMDAVIFIEGYSMGSSSQGLTSICEYGGLLRSALLAFNGPIYEVAPTTLKKFATGKGVGKKDMIAAHLTKRYNVLLESNDEYDAYALYRLGLIAEGLDKAETKWQQECAQTVINPKPKPKKKRKSLAVE